MSGAAIFSSPHADVAGTLLVPTASPGSTCVVIIGGTLSDTRDGQTMTRATPPREALKRLAEALGVGGYASLRYDRVGYGGSRPRTGWSDLYRHESEVAAAAIEFVRGQGFGRVVVAGESAGAYVACLAARDGSRADAYVFLGGLCSSAIDLFTYNFGRLVEYADRNPENLAWANGHVRRDLALGRHYREMFDAALGGANEFHLRDAGFETTLRLERLREELQSPPDLMFEHIQAPVLALAGARDLNVPPGHAAQIVQVVSQAGNRSAVSFLIPDADHSFQLAAPDADIAFRERYSFESYAREYTDAAYATVLSWLASVAPVVESPRLPGSRFFPTRQRGIEAPELDERTENTPERVQLAPSVEVIVDVTDGSKTAGVETLEGRIGPLLLGQDCQAHFIEMPSGMYLEEHPHGSESIIYTVQGSWVLCSRGRRQVMESGSLCRFDANTPTGYEVPFETNAVLLIFKGRRTTEDESDFMDYLRNLAGALEREHAAGTPFSLAELRNDHPAREFARAVTSGFGQL